MKEVFDAVYNPQKLKEYFTNAGSSGALEEGTTVLGQSDGLGHDPLARREAQRKEELVPRDDEEEQKWCAEHLAVTYI